MSSGDRGPLDAVGTASALFLRSKEKSGIESGIWGTADLSAFPASSFSVPG